jgi:DNA-binding beta-propeller fold protein YncE
MDESVERDPRLRQSLVALSVVFSVLLVVLVLILLFAVPRIEAPSYSVKAGIKPVRVLYGPGVGAVPFFNGPMGAAFGPDGRIHVADTGNNRVVVFDREGRYLFQFGEFGVGKPLPGITSTWKPGQLNYPTDVAVDSAGRIYVADFRNDQVQVFDPRGRFLRAFPDRTKPVGKGSSGQDGTGIAASSVFVDGGRVWVTDQYQIFEFTAEGKLLRQFGKPGGGTGDLDHPNGLGMNLGSRLIVSDSSRGRVVAFSRLNEVEWTFGEGDAIRADVQVPRGLVTTNDGSIYVIDAMGSTLEKLTPEGRHALTFGQRGVSPGELNYPTDVDWLGGRFVIADKGNDRVQLVELVEK